MGFYSQSDLQTKTKQKTRACGSCGLYKHCISPRMQCSGKGNRRVLIVGESPTVKEDQTGKRFTGKSGRLLKEALIENGFDLENDCRYMHAVNCYTEEKISDKELEACRPMLVKEIKSFKPHVIIVMGHAAAKSVIGSVFTESIGPLAKWQGQTIPDQTYKAWICPTFSPIQLLQDRQEVAKHFFKQAIKRALALTEVKVPDYSWFSDKVEMESNTKRINDKLRHFVVDHPFEFLAFDYETTGLKPYNEGHRILSCAVASENESFAFPFTDEIKESWIKFLKCQYIKKILANGKFEILWSRICLGSDVESFYYDTVLGAHILDNTGGTANVKFQAYVNFGVPEYNKHIKAYIESKDKCANSFNRMDKLDKRDLLLYNGLDSIIEFHLCQKQAPAFNL